MSHFTADAPDAALIQYRRCGGKELIIFERDVRSVQSAEQTEILAHDGKVALTEEALGKPGAPEALDARVYHLGMAVVSFEHRRLLDDGHQRDIMFLPQARKERLLLVGGVIRPGMGEVVQRGGEGPPCFVIEFAPTELIDDFLQDAKEVLDAAVAVY